MVCVKCLVYNGSCILRSDVYKLGHINCEMAFKIISCQLLPRPRERSEQKYLYDSSSDTDIFFSFHSKQYSDTFHRPLYKRMVLSKLSSRLIIYNHSHCLTKHPSEIYLNLSLKNFLQLRTIQEVERAPSHSTGGTLRATGVTADSAHSIRYLRTWLTFLNNTFFSTAAHFAFVNNSFMVMLSAIRRGAKLELYVLLVYSVV